MGKVRLGFRLEEDDRFVVMAEAASQGSSALAAVATETIYDHEDLFLKLVIYADLDDELTRQLVIAVILSVAEPARPGAWVAAEISADQNEVLGLNLPPDPPGSKPLQPVTNFTVGGETGSAYTLVFRAKPATSATSPWMLLRSSRGLRARSISSLPSILPLFVPWDAPGANESWVYAPGACLPTWPLDRLVRQEHHEDRP